MLFLTCPNCGVAAEETEFHGGGEAHIKRFSDGSDDKQFTGYLFDKKNPRGVLFERWRHVYGCGQWFHAARCSATLEIFGTYSAQSIEPPEAIIKAVRKKRPDWKAKS